MPIALSILLPFAELAGIAIGTVSTAVGVTALSNKVEDYIEDNPEQAEKIFAMIMPEQGLAALFNKEADSGDEEVSDEEVEVDSRSKKEIVLEGVRRAREGKGNYSSPDATGPAVSGQGNVIRGLKEAGKIRQDNDPNYDASKKYQGYKKWTKKADGGIMGGNKTYHQVRDQFMPMDSESMGYANGGGVGSMMQPKKVAIQGGVENYKPSEMVTAPKKAKSSPDHPSTELAYITQAEKDLLIKKDLHNSLNGSANKGPSGIISLNGGFGEPGGFQGGGNQSAAESGNKGAFGGGAENRARASAIRSAAINAGAGQKVNAGFFGGKYNDTVTQAEIAAAKAARNNPNNVFGAGAYDRTRGFGSTGLGGLMQGFNPLSMILGLINPFLGIASRGIMGLKNKFNDVTNNPDDLSLRERLTGYKTQAEYDKARTDRQVASRRDKMQSRIDQGYNSIFGMRTGPITDQQRATLANLNTQTGVSNNVIGGDPTSTRFDGFAPRIGLQTQPTQLFDPNNIQSLIDNAALTNSKLPGNDKFAEVTQMDLDRKNQFGNLDYGTAKDIGMISPGLTQEEFEGIKSGAITAVG